jgi:hypothetical protein
MKVEVSEAVGLLRLFLHELPTPLLSADCERALRYSYGMTEEETSEANEERGRGEREERKEEREKQTLISFPRN